MSPSPQFYCDAFVMGFFTFFSFLALISYVGASRHQKPVATMKAQVQRQECMRQLQPCLNYINTKADPPESCCKPLDYVIKSIPECLCSLMSIDGASQAEQAGINTTHAQTLPGRCGHHINPFGCVVGTPDIASSNTVSDSVTSIILMILSVIISFNMILVS